MSETIYNLKIGDMIETTHGFGVITKITSKKYYYRVLSHKHSNRWDSEHGIERSTFWQMLDQAEEYNELKIHYSSDMKYRRKRKKIEVQDKEV